MQRVLARLGSDADSATEQLGGVADGHAARDAVPRASRPRDVRRRGSLVSHLPVAIGVPVSEGSCPRSQSAVRPASSRRAGLRKDMKRVMCVAVLFAVCALRPTFAAPPAFVDITWMSISNMYLRARTSQYRDRRVHHTPSAGCVLRRRRRLCADAAAVQARRCRRDACDGRAQPSYESESAAHGAQSLGSLVRHGDLVDVDGRSHHRVEDDMPAGAGGSRCPPSGAAAVNGGETIALSEGVTMRVVRWNHSGDSSVNPEQHNPVELNAVPARDPATGGLRAGVAEDFPNGGGNRAYLFTVDGPDGRFSWFFNNSASAVDLHVPIVVDGVDLWRADREPEIGDGGREADVGRFVDRRERRPGCEARRADPQAEGISSRPLGRAVGTHSRRASRSRTAIRASRRFSRRRASRVVEPAQYMDKWRLDRNGVRPVANTEVKKALGFN